MAEEKEETKPKKPNRFSRGAQLLLDKKNKRTGTTKPKPKPVRSITDRTTARIKGSSKPVGGKSKVDPPKDPPPPEDSVVTPAPAPAPAPSIVLPSREELEKEAAAKKEAGDPYWQGIRTPFGRLPGRSPELIEQADKANKIVEAYVAAGVPVPEAYQGIAGQRGVGSNPGSIAIGNLDPSGIVTSAVKAMSPGRATSHIGPRKSVGEWMAPEGTYTPRDISDIANDEKQTRDQLEELENKWEGNEEQKAELHQLYQRLEVLGTEQAIVQQEVPREQKVEGHVGGDSIYPKDRLLDRLADIPDYVSDARVREELDAVLNVLLPEPAERAAWKALQRERAFSMETPQSGPTPFASAIEEANAQQRKTEREERIRQLEAELEALRRGQ